MLKKVFTFEGPLHTKAEGLTFSLYSAEEIQKISVVKVITPLAFNALGHPLPGGLYDPAMGPYDMSGICQTCQQTFLFCPGHFGRIELPLPVINPLFSKTLLTMFRLSCLGCHTITIPGAVRQLSMTQLKLIRLGLVKEAQDAEFVMCGVVAGNDGEDGKKKRWGGRGGGNSGNNAMENVVAQDRFNEYLDTVLGSDKKLKRMVKRGSSVTSTKNAESIRRVVVKRLLSHAKMTHKCFNCGLLCKQMKLFNSQIFYTLVTPGAKNESRRMEQDETDEFLDGVLGKIGVDIDPATSGTQKYLTPSEAKDHMRMLWMNEADFLKELFPVLQSTTTNFPTDLFFVDVVAVPPPKNRAAKMLNNMMVEHPQNLALRHVVTSCTMLTYTSIAIKKGLESLSQDALKALKGIAGESLNEKLETVWKDLQADVDHVMDREKSKVSAQATSQMIGLKQVIEKKEGLFRMHMMGKRVNFAARTVITPDPLIHIEEIGIPDVFAKVLTFPTPVTNWNVHFLRKLIINGPNVHPGAIAVENELGQVSRLNPNDEDQRRGIANRLLTTDKIFGGTFKGVKTVQRHLLNGDLLLLNRQPSLHRPSIMAHRARVLYGEKVLRLHYANCKHYNADFDGDEMNAHFPQSHLGRSEAANLVNVCSHFLVPKDGTPLSGLIQDHVVAGVRLTLRGRFFNQRDYHQLVNFALGSSPKCIHTERPAIMKPEFLWSGKQVISSVVKNLIPHGKFALSFHSGAKIKAQEWVQCEPKVWKYGGPIHGDDMSESVVIFRQGELLSGVLDKVQMGATPYGLIHAFYELYGSEAAGALLTAFSRLMTNFLQWEGFTLGVKDVLVTAKADDLRHHYMIEASQIGPKAAAAGVSIPEDSDNSLVYEKLEQVHRTKDGGKSRAFVDLCYKRSLDQFTNQINKTCLPYGLVSIFPQNNLQLLVQSGAKGSTVNTMQMSCALGQIELEGKRPPLTISGKSLPSFKTYDVSPRAGGFIAGRFLTGIRPQEFFFHCMAGREGLIDTAVKTSRSGYLQRCLVKLLEGLVTQYDGTVRDSDGSVVQFLYGEDGLDVCKSQYLKEKQLGFLEETTKTLFREESFQRVKDLGDQEMIKDNKKQVALWKSEQSQRPIGEGRQRSSGFLKFAMENAGSVQHLHGINPKTGRLLQTEQLCTMWASLSQKKKSRYPPVVTPDPLLSYLHPFSNFSVISENLEEMINRHCSKSNINPKKFRKVVYDKAMKALSTPGDAVGILAAQSVGEPSTQMTLNTFHFAGRGEMNVTLGIPRLREILMVASANIKTPCMDIPFKAGVTEKQAEKLRLQLTSVTMAQVLEYVEISELVNPYSHSRVYRLNFMFLKKSEFVGKFCVRPRNILEYFERSFLRSRLLPHIRRLTKQKKEYGIDSVKEGRAGGDTGDNDEEPEGIRTNLYEEQERRGMGEGHESSDEEPEPEDADATQQNRRARQGEKEYDAPEEEEREVLGDEDNDELELEDESRANNNNSVGREVEQDDEGESTTAVNKIPSSTYDARIECVISSDDMIQDYDFDRENEKWCTLTISVPLSVEKLNMSTVLRTVCDKSVIHQVPQITRAFLIKPQMLLKTEGINILAMAEYRDLLDLNRLHCNNIHTMAEHYGIEAASRVIVKEMTDVFKAYGIVIDPRHLTLIADYMTFSGSYRPFNRIGIESSASPLHQMSFETVVSFLRDAALTGKHDDLSNPSSRLVLGKPVSVGTGLFTLKQKLNLGKSEKKLH